MVEGTAVRILVATRGSPLALWQADRVADLLRSSDPGIEVGFVVVATTGDLDRTTPLEQMGGQGVFVKEIQAAVLDGRADLAVHSAKDLPALTPDGLLLAAIPERGDPRDALVGCRLADLPEGARVATGSIRRRAHLAHRRPDLRFEPLRGNIATRLARTADVDAVVVAQAALDRLGLVPDVVDPLDPGVLLPQVAQGALAVECRADDATTAALLSGIENSAARLAVDAERGFLAELGSGCDLPVAAHARVLDDGSVGLTGAISSPEGDTLLLETRQGTDPETVGRALARHLLDERGGAALLGPA
ncbi:MAG: hydroxymethylbilane synthase [Actinobacteria bacterium]|jgi:hydroxymethylbilane synthase|uniref:hydroxymethylbilane synthase n=1 Tax=marine metagenome TaxID=408172 RepID=A0A382DNN0_9ZZZZ|nr:hydroxymethylbilane synthase [Actinomycetota bacterium]|tara:strand:+ start:6915 stop:7829 length:915 start_codon:yes stop_codon:yes gene_type:complete